MPEEKEVKLVAKYHEDVQKDLVVRGAQNYGVAQGLMIAARLAEKRGQPSLGEELRKMAARYGV